MDSYFRYQSMYGRVTIRHITQDFKIITLKRYNHVGDNCVIDYSILYFLRIKSPDDAPKLLKDKKY